MSLSRSVLWPPRLPRYFVKGQPQHAIQHGNNREPIFASKEDYRFYLYCLHEAGPVTCPCDPSLHVLIMVSLFQYGIF